MRKRLCNRYLRSLCRRPTRQRGFSLAELVVAIGILVLMFSLAGQVFNVTIQSTGQAKALTQVSQLLRAFEQTLREDLRQVQPGQSVIMIQGNPVNAYWTREGKEADNNEIPADGYPHQSDPNREDDAGNMIKPRADVLMFFTARKATSFVHPGITSNLQQVVYGHAELGEYVPPTAPGAVPYVYQAGLAAFPVDPANNDYPSLTLISPVPAERWHLSRRGVLLVPTETPAPPTVNLPLGLAGLNDLLVGKTDVIGNFSYEEVVLKPGPGEPWYLPGIIDPADPAPRSPLDLSPPPLLGDRLGAFFLSNCASFKVEWMLDSRSEFVAGRLDGTREIYWFDPGRFDEIDANEHPLMELERAAAEATGEKRMRLLNLLDGPTSHPDGKRYSLADRFLGVQLQSRRGRDPNPAWAELAADTRPNLVVFGAARINEGKNEIVPEDIFPSALRITIDLFDSKRRLDRPVRHVMVVPVGG